jgi:hypothetical protein
MSIEPVMPNLPVQKRSYYVDETGQDTEGKLFIVAIVMAQGDQDTLRTILSEFEQASGKGKKKWTKATRGQRQAYMERVVQEAAFQGRLFFCRFQATREYLTCVCESIARVPAAVTGTTPAPVAVFIDGLGRNERHQVGTLLRRRQITVDKVRGLRDESDELIRLADAVAGFVRDQLEEDTYPQLYGRAVHRGIIQEV